VRRGGSCNFEQYTFVPHCNGTHTEGIGHLTAERISVHERLRESLVPATLASVRPVLAGETTDTYTPALHPEDRVITAAALEAALATAAPGCMGALVLRTLPNDPDKTSRDYMQVPPPFFTREAMQLIRTRGVRHLLVDIPSLDRLFDEGRLTAHRIFWGLPPGTDTPDDPAAAYYTVTEMIWVPDTLPDGPYLLELQIAPFVADAAPSRPRLFALVAVAPSA
jgi:kynurenine formamidase